jgi:hypothetical protein
MCCESNGVSAKHRTRQCPPRTLEKGVGRFKRADSQRKSAGVDLI